MRERGAKQTPCQRPSGRGARVLVRRLAFCRRELRSTGGARLHRHDDLADRALLAQLLQRGADLLERNSRQARRLDRAGLDEGRDACARLDELAPGGLAVPVARAEAELMETEALG